MRRAERLFRLVQELRAHGVTRAEDLARRFEVSPRTVYRDIAHLQGSGLPIDGAAGVGYLLRPGFDLPPMTFTHDQIEALAVGLALVEALDDPALATAAREARAKIQAGLPRPGTLEDAPFFALRRSTGAPPHAAPLREAIRRRQVMHMVYADGTGARTDRRLRPLAIWSLADGWMVSGWCELRGGFRTFRLDRIIALAPTGEGFPPDPDRDLAAFMRSDDCAAPRPASAAVRPA